MQQEVEATAAPPLAPPNSQMLHSPSVKSSRLTAVAPTPSPSVQLVNNTPQTSTLPPPPPKDPLTARNSGQILSSVFNQLLHSDHESTIASLFSSSDGQSMGTPASVEPHLQRSPPLSVLSNCSYPATPGLNSNNNSSCSNTNIPSVSVPAINANPSPIDAIFEAAEVGDGSEINPNPAPPPPPPPPRGLAAYLPKSRHHEAVASPLEDGGVDAYARQHSSVPPISSTSSSPWTERRGAGLQANTTTAAVAVPSGIYHATSSCSLTSTPNGQESGKEKRGTYFSSVSPNSRLSRRNERQLGLKFQTLGVVNVCDCLYLCCVVLLYLYLCYECQNHSTSTKYCNFVFFLFILPEVFVFK